MDTNCYRASFGTSSGLWQGSDPLGFSFPLLSLQLFLVVLTTRTLYFLLKPLKQPRVVSEIIGGIILGPSVLGRSRTFREVVFPARGMPVLDTVASFGLMYVIFLIGVKMDPGLVRRSGRKALVIGLSSLILPLAITMGACFILSSYVVRDTKQKLSFFMLISTSLSLTSFAVLVPILSELKLLNSELGRIAMSSSMTNDGMGWLIIMMYTVVEASMVSAATMVYAILSLAGLVLFILCVVRPTAIWVIDHTPPGKPVDEGYIFIFLIIVLVVGFFSDIVGTNSFHGALVLGLAIPDGPPLGTALAEKMDCVVTGLLLPLYYTLTGLNTNVFAIEGWTGWGMLQLVIVLGWTGKLLGTLLPSLYFKIPIRDAISLSLFMNVKGIVEVVSYQFWKNNKLLDDHSFAILMLSTVTVTAVITPIASILYEPSRRYMVYKRRAVQYLKPDTEFRILASVHDQTNVPTAINLLEASHATRESPVIVYALHLVQLVGRAAPLFIPHKVSRSHSSTHHNSESEHIINAFRIYEQRHQGVVSVNPFTTISPYASMHDEVCRLALEKRTSLIILPFHKKHMVGGGTESNNGLRTMNRNVISHAPCSVGILVDPVVGGAMCTLTGNFSHHVAVFFFGGEDDREALAYAQRMANHPGVSITVIRFLPSISIRDDQAERKLDNRLLDEFRLYNASNERVVYREALVKDMEEIVGVIRALNNVSYDILIVGMRHKTNSVLSEGLAAWSECPELGVVGDFLASPDFRATFSVLVIKQQDQLNVQLPNLTGKNRRLTAGENTDHAEDEVIQSPRRLIGDGLYVRFRNPQQ